MENKVSMTAKETMEWLNSKMTEKGIPHMFDNDYLKHKENNLKHNFLGEEDGSTYQIVIHGKDGSQISDCIMVL